MNSSAETKRWWASESSGHLGSQLPLPLVGAVEGRAAAGTVAEDGALCKVADVAALVERVLSCLQSRLQLLPQQQVVPGLLHLKTPAGTNVTSAVVVRKGSLIGTVDISSTL